MPYGKESSNIKKSLRAFNIACIAYIFTFMSCGWKVNVFSVFFLSIKNVINALAYISTLKNTDNYKSMIIIVQMWLYWEQFIK